MADAKYLPPEDDFPEKRSSGNGSVTMYSVQARLAYHEPREVAGHLLDLRWKTINTVPAGFGIPSRRFHNVPDTGLLSYQAAQSIRWWFLAQAEAEFSCMCVVTRLVEHVVNYNYSTEATRAVETVGEGEDRGNIMPVKNSERSSS